MFSKDELKALMKETGKGAWTLINDFEKTVEAASKELREEKEAEQLRKEQEKQKQEQEKKIKQHQLEDCAADVLMSIGNFLEVTGDAELCARVDELIEGAPSEMIGAVKVLVFSFIASLDVMTQVFNVVSNEDSSEDLSNEISDVMRALLF